MASALKTIVSKKKLRYVGEGYNLDLSYITDRLIAMGFPAEKLESLYRNNWEEVRKFLDEKHGADHYKIYNLCAERERLYDPAKFHGRVDHYPFDDHHPPKFEMIKRFCDNVTNWLAQDQSNVAVVHCKAGKGRTGVMICCFLLHSGFYAAADQVLEHYGKQRTVNEKGVTIPSQRRYIRYYDMALRNHLTYTSVKMYLTSVVLDFVPCLGSTDNYLLQFEVTTPTRNSLYTSIWFQVRGKERYTELPVSPPLLISDDVKIEFSYKPLIKPKLVPPKKEFHFWFNTFFIDKDLKNETGVTVSWSTTKKDDNLMTSLVDETPAALDTFFTGDNALPERHASGGAGGDGVGVGLVVNPPGCEEQSKFTNLMKTASISDDTLLREQQQQRLVVSFAPGCPPPPPSPPPSSSDGAGGGGGRVATRTSSFINERMRHSSVPQAAASGRSLRIANGSDAVINEPGDLDSEQLQQQLHSKKSQVFIEGERLTFKLTKPIIDKACKQRGKVYSPDFNVMLFLIKPKEQENLIDYTLTTPAAAGNPRTPLSSQSSGESSAGGGSGGGGGCGVRHQPLSNSSSAACVGLRLGASEGEQSSPESSSEEETVQESSERSTSGSNHTATTNHHHHHFSLASSISSPSKTDCQKPRTSMKHPWSMTTTTTTTTVRAKRGDADHGSPPREVQFSSIKNIMLSNKTTTQTTLIQ